MMGAQVHPESEPFLLSPMTPIDISPESHPEKVQWQRHHQCGTRYQHNHRKWWFSIAAVCGLITLIFLNVAFYLVFLPTTDRLCAQRLSTYSPAFDAIHEYEDVMFHGELFVESSEFRGTPSPEIDAAWERISPQSPIPISTEQIAQIGKSLEMTVRYPEEQGGQYAGSLEVFHQLHCLDLLRKATYFNYYSDKENMFKTTPRMVRQHLDHCIDLLRIQLMCVSDITPVTFNITKGSAPYSPDFYTSHRCRNFDSVLDWYEERQLDFDS